MGPDGYKVEVLHYLNPYLIWVEVVDPRIKSEEYVFEQVGIYGLLPLKTTIDDSCEGVNTSLGKDWTQAATLLMKEFFHNAVEIYFAPTYIDRRTSIFDDNVHKYGELMIIHKNGKEKSLSRSLVKNNLALKDECLFHQELLAGKIKTKLNINKTNAVIFEIEQNCLKKEKQKKSIRKQAHLLSTAQQLESSLTIHNVQVLNSLRDENISVEEYLQNKFKDIEMCRDIDEEPIGRGCSHPPSTCSSRHSVLKARLKLHKQASAVNDSKALLKATKQLLIANAVKKTPVKSPSLTSESEMSIKIDTSPVNYEKSNIYDQEVYDSSKNQTSTTNADKMRSSLKNLSRVKKFLQSQEKKNELEPQEFSDEKENIQNFDFQVRNIEKLVVPKVYDETKIAEDVEMSSNIVDERSIQNIIDMQKEIESSHHPTDISPVNRIKKVSKMKRSPQKLPDYDISTHKSIAFGPPEPNPSQLIVKIVPKNVIENEIRTEIKAKEVQIPMPEKEDAYENVDSHIAMEITNKDIIKQLHKQALEKLVKVEIKKPLTQDKEKDQIDPQKVQKTVKIDKPISVYEDTHNVQETPKFKPATIPPNDNSLHDESSSEDQKKSSSLLKRKLHLYKQSMDKHNTANSDTSTKDSSTSMEQDKPKACSQQHTELDSDDECNSEILNKIETEYPDTEHQITKEIIEQAASLKNNVNPFKNVEANISVFVEKLVTPVLMVHSKFNKRIQPVFELRDVPFNPHIQVMLKSMSIQRPMILQSVSWFSILRGYSTFLISPSGSGKTMGYLPAVCRLVTDGSGDKYSSGPLCIIVCATAKSVADIERLSKVFLHQKDKVLACHPGMNELNLLTSILNGCDLLICTPSILVRLLKNNEFGVDLKRLMTFVLDDCERLSEVYSSEIKFFLLKIKEAQKTRVDQILKVQYILASRIWCDFMEPLAKRAPNTLISIGAFQECVLYAKANMTASFIPNESKINSILDFLKDIDASKKTVIVCRSDDEVELLEQALKKTKHVVFACNNTMTVQILYDLSLAWNEYQEPVTGPILVCCDGNLLHLNVTDAHYLIHYSLPHLFSEFCKRFSVLNDNYASIFKDSNEDVKIKVLIDDSNVEQLPKIMHFIKRCREEVPKVLDEICEKVLAQKDAIKAKEMVPICDNLLAFGECPDYWNCRERHAIFKDCDAPKHWMPKNGVVTFKIIHYHTATQYSARLLSHTVKGETVKFQQLYTMLSMKISTYYAKESNKRLHGIPKVGDICAVALKQNLFVRCQVVKILTYYQNKNPNYIIVKLIDEEKYERTRDIYLYHLPDEMKHVETHVVLVRMANIQPKDKDVTFSELALNQLKYITDANDELYLRGEIALTVGNCIFVHNLETCRDLSSMNETVVRHNFKQELEPFAVPKPDHLPKLEKMCFDSGLPVEKVKEKLESPKIKPLPRARWAHLEKDDFSAVFFASAENPGTFFIRLVKFEDCLSILVKDIQKHVAEDRTVATEIKRGDIVLAKFPDDEWYERARIEEVDNEKVKCFFVDQGDWRYLPKTDISPITEKFITQLPFQAIECRLIGVEPSSEEWTEFCTNWFINCFEDSSNDLKQVYAKYFTKEIPLHTGGHKYGVVLIDTTTDEDVVINKLIVEVNLARVDEKEVEYLNNLNFESKPGEPEESDDDDDWEKISNHNYPKEISNAEPKVPFDKIFLKQPIRSVPLVGSDESDIDNIDFNMASDFMELFKPFAEAAKLNVPAIGETKSPRSGIGANLERQSDTLSDSDISIVKSINSNDKELSSSYEKEKDSENGQTINLDPIFQNKTTAASNDTRNQNVPPSKEKVQNKVSNVRNNKLKVTKNLSKNLNNSSLDSDDFTSAEISSLYENVNKSESSDTSSKISNASKTIKPVVADQIIESFENKLHINTEDTRIPKLVWRQTTTDIFIKIQIIGAEKYNLEVKEKHLKFEATVDDVKYSFEFELYGVVDKNKVTHSNKGQYVLVNLKKVLKKNWLMLNWNGPKKYIVYDVDHIDESSSEDEVIDERANLVKRLINASESESDDDFIDDINYNYKRYVD